MNGDRYVAAIEICSSKIIVAVGTINSKGALTILAAEQNHGVEGVRYGVIQNPEYTSMRIQNLIDKIQKRPGIAPRKIENVFVGLSGRSVRSITTEVRQNLPEDTEITDAIINDLRAEALSQAVDSSLEIVDAIPRSFKVGNIDTETPKGSVGNSISATFELVVCRPELKKNLIRTITDKLGIKIAGAMVTALSVGQIVLTAEDKRLGCMLVDMGAETTTITIYKDGSLRYFATLPLGGRHITRDLTTLSMLEEKAEDLKITSGDALARETPSSLNFNGVKMSDVSNYVVARSEEIIANIVEQISYAGLSEADLPGGIICIGGGSKLRGILELLGNQSGLEVRRGQLPNYITFADSKGATLEMIEVASVLYAGATNTDVESLVMPHSEELPENGPGISEIEEEEEGHKKGKQKEKKPRNGFFTKFTEQVSKMFSVPDPEDEDESDLME